MSITQVIISFAIAERNAVLEIGKRHSGVGELIVAGMGVTPAFSWASSVDKMEMDKFLTKLEPFLFDLLDSATALLAGTRILIFAENQGVFVAREVFIERTTNAAMLKMAGHVCPFSWGI